MNSSFQPDSHPGAESLNAFVEHVLPERERAQILAHLSACGRCRQVIFLAQEAASGLESGAAAAVPAAHSAARTGSLLSGWRLAWIPAVAVTAIVAVGILVHVRHAEPGPELARVTPQLAPQNEAGVSKSLSKEPVDAGKPQPPASPVTAKLATGRVRSAPVRAAPEASSAEAVPPAAPMSETEAIKLPSTEREAAALPSGAPRRGMVAAQFKPEPAAAAPQPERVPGTLASKVVAAQAAQAGMGGGVGHAQTSRAAPVTASISQLRMAPAPQGNFAAGAQLPMVQIEAARKAKIVMLPSGLGIVSAATARNRMLAVDQAGALFLSEDSGKHWDSVARQWVGRVVAVRLQQALNGNATEAGSEGAQQESGVVADVAITPIPPAAVFEIVNEKDLIWTSTDGKNWKAK